MSATAAIEEGADGALFPAVRAPRSIIFLFVPWSGPAIRARQVFREAAEDLAKNAAETSVALLEMDEDGEFCHQWLTTLGIPHLDGTYSIGAGSIIWLTFGQVAIHEISGCSLQANEIVARTLSLWGDPARQPVH